MTLSSVLHRTCGELVVSSQTSRRFVAHINGGYMIRWTGYGSTAEKAIEDAILEYESDPKRKPKIKEWGE